MDLRIDDHAPVDLGGRLGALHRQHRAGAKGTGDKAASTQHGSVLPEIPCGGVLFWAPPDDRLCAFPASRRNRVNGWSVLASGRAGTAVHASGFRTIQVRSKDLAADVWQAQRAQCN